MGDLDGLRVNHAALELAAEQMFDTVKKLDARLQKLDQDVQPLTTQWEGSAQASWKTAHQKWSWAMQEMRNLLDQSKQTVYESNDQYRAADARGANAFEQIHG
jgi:early secretory antigenic target protein ESAT-6